MKELLKGFIIYSNKKNIGRWESLHPNQVPRLVEKAKHTIMSSDAFFPFRDGIDEAANQHNMAMVFTNIGLFWH